MENKNKNLYNLDELSDYKVASDYSDVRGWEVKDKNNIIVGKVEHLLVNKEAERVVYLDVEVDASLIAEGHEVYQNRTGDGIHEFLNKEGENHLIIPIGLAHIDDENKFVSTNQLDVATFARAKRYRKGDNIDFDYELNAVRHYAGDQSIHHSNTADGFYDRSEFDYIKSV